MLVPIKQILLEGYLKDKFDNIANGGSYVNYDEKAQEKDGRVAKVSAYLGAPTGAVIGGLVDGMIDGGPDETSGDGAAIGGLIGFGAPLAYGINNNHQFINKERILKAKKFIRNKFSKDKNINNPSYKA